MPSAHICAAADQHIIRQHKKTSDHSSDVITITVISGASSSSSHDQSRFAFHEDDPGWATRCCLWTWSRVSAILATPRLPVLQNPRLPVTVLELQNSRLYKSQFTPYIFNQQYVMYSIGIPRFSLEFHLALILIFNSSSIMLCIWVGKTLYVIFACIL